MCPGKTADENLFQYLLTGAMSTGLCRYVSHKDRHDHKEKNFVALVALLGNIMPDMTPSASNLFRQMFFYIDNNHQNY
jgi:hypothetical protein